MKRILGFFISLSIGIGLLIWIIQFVGWQGIESSLVIFTGWQWLVILLLTFLILFVGALKWKVILKNQGHPLSIRALIGPYLTCYSISYLFQMMVVGGELFRIYVLKEKYAVPWKKAVSSVVIDKILEATSFLIAVLVGLGFFLLKIGMPPRNLAIVVGGFVLLLVVGISFFYFKCFKKESIARPIVKFFHRQGLPNGDILEIEKETFNYFKLQKAAFWQGLGLAFLRVVITWLRCWLLVLFLGKGISVLVSLSVLSFAYIAMMVPIPADLGAHEAIQVFVFGALGLEASVAPAFTMIQRGAELMMALIGIVIFFKLGMGLFQTVLFKKLNGLINNKT